MANVRRTLLGSLSMLLFWLGTLANAAQNSASNPYQGIVDRNLFRLKPPPPAFDPPANNPPLPAIRFQGLITLGSKRALLKVQMPARPGEQPKGEQTFILAEGQREGDIEVLEIDEVARTVKVSYFGTTTNLNFENNGIRTAAAPAAVGQHNPTAFAATPASTARPMVTPATASVAQAGFAAAQDWSPQTRPASDPSAIMGAAYMLKHKDAIQRVQMPPLPGLELPK